MREVYIVDAARTAFCKMGGNLRDKAGTQLAGIAVKGLVERSKICECGKVDGVFVGSARHCSVAQNPGRYLIMEAGLPIETEGHYVEAQSGSAIAAINQAASQIALGYADVCIAGGFESWSTTYAKYSQNIEPYTLQPPMPIRQKWTSEADEDMSPLESSENVAKRWGISRSECDAYAASCREKFAEAVESGFTGEEIVPYTIPATRKTPEVLVDKDDAVLPASISELGNLKTMVQGGVNTAGNSGALSDGAAVVLLMSAEKARELGYEPMAKWVIGADVGVPNSVMGIGSARAAVKSLEFAKLSADEIDVYELSDAFAADVLAAKKEIELCTGKNIDIAKINPNGGSVAIGNANGATGARMALFAMKELGKTGGRYALVSCSCEGGQGVSMVLENLRR